MGQQALFTLLFLTVVVFLLSLVCYLHTTLTRQYQSTRSKVSERHLIRASTKRQVAHREPRRSEPSHVYLNAGAVREAEVEE